MEETSRDAMIKAWLASAKFKLRFVVICLQRRYREYGFRTIGKIRFLRDLKVRMDEEAAKERQRREMEEERKKEEEARAAEELARKEEERKAKLAEAAALAAETKEKARRIECEIRARRIIEAAMARLTVPELTPEERAEREAERQRKGKALAIDVDAGTDVSITPKRIAYLAEETGNEEVKAEVRRLVGIVRKGVQEGVIAKDVGEAAIFQIRDTGRWPSEEWEKACDFDNWQATRQALRQAAREADISGSVEEACKDTEGQEVVSKPKSKKKTQPQTHEKTSSKVPPLILHTSEGSVERFVDKTARSFYKTLAGRNTHQERPFNANIREIPEFKEFMEERGLGKMVDVCVNASWELAREFYANLAANLHIAHLAGEDVDMHVYVRGINVDFSVAAINRYLGRPETPVDEVQKQLATIIQMDEGRTSGTWSSVANICATQNESVYYNARRTLVTWKSVPEEHKGWLEWIGAHMIVMGRVTEIPVRTIFVWDKLLKGAHVDVGSLIVASMIRAVENPKSNFGHTHLIYGMCLEAGVPISKDELVLPPGRCVNLREEWLKKRGWTLAQVPHRRVAHTAPKRKHQTPSAELSPSPTKKRTRLSAVPGTSAPAPASTSTPTAPAVTSSTSRQRPPRVKHVLLKMPPPLPERPIRPTTLNQENALGFMADSMNWLMDAVAQLDHYQRRQIKVSNNHSRAFIRLDDSDARLLERQSLQLEAMKADAVGQIKKSNKILQELVSESETDDEDDDVDDAPPSSHVD